MEPMYYIGLDVHKRKISYCVKDSGGRIFAEGSLPATRIDLDLWMNTLPQPWSAAMEATMFTGWIYDCLNPHVAVLKVAHPLMLRAIAAAKKKNDRIRREQDLRLLAVRFSARVLHGSDGWFWIGFTWTVTALIGTLIAMKLHAGLQYYRRPASTTPHEIIWRHHL